MVLSVDDAQFAEESRNLELSTLLLRCKHSRALSAVGMSDFPVTPTSSSSSSSPPLPTTVSNVFYHKER